MGRKNKRKELFLQKRKRKPKKNDGMFGSKKRKLQPDDCQSTSSTGPVDRDHPEISPTYAELHNVLPTSGDSEETERGVELVKQKRIADAFRRFSKALKMLIAIEPINPEVIDEDSVQQMIDLKVKLYNNLAHCQLYYKEYEAAIQLCDKALKFHPHSAKALYRRCVARSHLHLYEEAWDDIQKVLQLDPGDKAAQQRAKELKIEMDKINKEYSTVIKKMFG